VIFAKAGFLLKFILNGKSKLGLPIGSGKVESTIKQIGFRVKLAGASWSQRNVPKILRLRTAFLNNSPSLIMNT